jgi:flagellar basal-body rod protein FlgB
MLFQASPTSEILARAIDVCAMRQAVYTANIANANVEGYRRLEVAFDAEAMRAEVAARGSMLRTASYASATQPEVVMTAESTVKLDEEMAAMAQNALRYQMLLGAYERSTGALKLAINDGREA